MDADLLARLDAEAVERYEAAADRARGALHAWEEAGSPLTVTYSNGIEATAPLLKVLVELEAHAHRLYRALPRTKRVGRPPSAVVTPFAPPPRIKRKTPDA